MSEATIPIKELMEKTEQWLLGQGYKKSTLGFYRATWNRFLSYSASPAYSRETAEQFLLQYFGVDVHAIDQTLDGRMRHTGIITVHNGKGGKDRLVPVHNSVIEYLRSYSAQLPDEREWFFPSACGHYSIKTIYDNFRELLFACNIPHTGNGPRVHDFRHTFAVHTLEKQLSDGYDPMVIVPRLAAYLGHKSYRETCWYIHLTVASFPELSQKLDRAFVGIIPVGGETDEEN